MPAPLGKHTRMPGAKRPWSVRESETPYIPLHRETKRDLIERPICLSCTEPDCPSPGCPLPVPKYEGSGRPKRGPTEEFLDWAWGPMTAKEWAGRIGVNESTIRRWKRQYAEEIEARRIKRMTSEEDTNEN